MATMTTAVKITKIGTDSGDVTPPNPTPATDAASDIVSVHEVNLAQVSQTLEPVQEVLNEAAEEPIFPTPPLNSPIQGFSPAPSTISGCHRPHNLTRRRGLSYVQDRLHHLTLTERIHHRWTNGSLDDTNSIPDTVSQAPESEADAALGPRSPAYSTTGTIPVAIGSPSSNPLFSSYAAFDSASTAHLNEVLHPKDEENGGVSIVGNMAGRDPSPNRETQPTREGCHEKSIWADEVMGDLDRALKRLEQLAADEADVAKATGKTACAFYLERLQKALNGDERKHNILVKETEHRGSE